MEAFKIVATVVIGFLGLAIPFVKKLEDMLGESIGAQDVLPNHLTN